MLTVLAVAGAVPVAAAPRCPPRDNDALTPWRQVTWKDFRGKVGSRLGPEAAHIATDLKLDDIEAEVTQEGEDAWVARPQRICLYAAMNKLHSAARPGSDTDYALRHEQLHFDLTELTARRLHPELMGLEGRGDNAQRAEADLRRRVYEARAAGLKALEALQQEYDGSTAHGTTWLQQKAWQRKIRRWLDETPAYTP